jgi:hypothetical protein
MALGLRPAALLAGIAIAAGLPWGVAGANVGKAPRIEVSCLRSQTMLRPVDDSVSVADPGAPARMRPVTICKEERRACYAVREEVPMSRCAPAH